jgi:hypothetical protein
MKIKIAALIVWECGSLLPLFTTIAFASGLLRLGNSWFATLRRNPHKISRTPSSIEISVCGNPLILNFSPTP